MGSEQQFCLRWNNHQTNLLSVFDQLLQNESFVDVTLACDGLSLKAHKVVLSACSPYFQNLLLQNPCQHPIVILKDVSYADLKALVDFMYKGEVNVSQEQLTALLKTAEMLKVKGLSEVAPSQQLNTTSTTIITQNSNVTSNASTSLLAQLSGSCAVQVELCQSSTPLPRPTPPGSPPMKRKKGHPRRRSGSGSELSDTEGGNSVVEIEGSPEMIESKVDVSQTATSGSEESVQEQNPPLHLPLPIPQPMSIVAGDQDSIVAKREVSPPIPAPITQIRSCQEDVDKSQCMDQSSMMSMPGYSMINQGPPQQYNPSQSVPSHIPSDPVEDDPKDELMRFEDLSSDGYDQGDDKRGGPHWTSENMNSALTAVRNCRMSLSKASIVYGIPCTTLWQRARKEGIDTTKRDPNLSTNWTEDNINQALDAIRAGRLSITKAAVTYGIPNTTLWQRSRKEGIDTSRNNIVYAHQSTWTEMDLSQALEAVRTGRMSMNKASATFGIPSTTLWSRAKRHGIDTTRRNFWDQDRDEVMSQALQAVKAGLISMTQASIKYNVPYTTLWKHFKKWEMSCGGPGSGHHHHHHHHMPMAGHMNYPPVTGMEGISISSVESILPEGASGPSLPH